MERALDSSMFTTCQETNILLFTGYAPPCQLVQHWQTT